MGSVVITVEVGAGWGMDSDDGVTEAEYREAIEAWRRASYLFDRHEVPATWLVAGHLLGPAGRRETPADREGSTATDDTPTTDRATDDERTGDGGPASDRQGASRDAGDEPDAPPCLYPNRTDRSRSTHGSATDRSHLVRSVRDLVAALRQSRVAHEIGCLPFSALDVADADQEEAVAAVRTTIDAAAELGVETEQLRAVGFADDVGHRDVLAAYGFECYRGPKPSSGPLSTLDTLLRFVVRRLPGTGPQAVEARTDDHGMVAIPISASLHPLAGRARALARVGPRDPVADLAKRGLDRADGADGVFHLSLRVGDLRTEADFERLEAVLERVADRRGERGLAVETMGEVARRLGNSLTRPTTPVR